MGAAPKGLGPQDPTKKLNQPLFQTTVLNNLVPEPPPTPLKATLLAISPFN